MLRQKTTFIFIIALALNLLGAGKVSAEDFIVRVSPLRNALNVKDTSRIIIYFNVPMDAATMSPEAIRVHGSQSGLHAAKITYDAIKKTTTLIPQVKFFPGEVVEVLVKNSLKSASGLAMRAPYQWNFTIEVGGGTIFFAPTSKVELKSPYGIVTGDFDRDGDLDLATTLRSDNKVAILKNDGYGRFAMTTTTLVGSTPNHLAAGDLDADGDLDLAIANMNGNTLTILKNDGSGVFKATTLTPSVSSAPFAPVVGDWDGDGNLDLAVSNNGAGGGTNSGVSILLNNGAAVFQKTATIDAIGCEFGVVPGDWDDDGDLDLAVSSHCLFGVSILYNDGKGNFKIATRIDAGAYPFMLVAGDLNEDGDVDLVTSNRNDATSANSTVSILANRRGDFHKSATPLVAGAHPLSVALGDFDHDGKLDLAVANSPAGTISLLHNDGAGEFTLVATPPAGLGPDFITSGDFDGDGDLDIAATNSTGNTITILKNGVTELVKLAITSGQQQRGAILTALQNSLVVTATDAQGKPVSGVNVNFAIASVPQEATGAMLNATSVTTGNDGQAAVILKLGSKVGTYTVNATSGQLNDGAPVTFTATAIAGAATNLSYAAGDRQVGKITTALATPLTVTVTDVGGNTVAGANVNFALANAPAGATGQTLSETSPITNSYGQATTSLKLGSKIGEYRVNAFLPGQEGTPFTFVATAETGNLKTIKLTAGHGQTGQIKTALTTALEITITDEGGNPVPNLPVNFLVTKTPVNALGHSVNPALLSTNSSGKAATVFTLGNQAGIYNITASAANVLDSPILFSATASAGPAAKIFIISGNAQSGAINTSLAKPLTVTVTDAEGNSVTNAQVAFAIKSKPIEATGEALSVSNATTDRDGRAATILTLGNKVGTYFVTATANGLSGSPLTFTAIANAGVATTLARTSGHAQTKPINTALPEPFVVTVTDAGGNPVQGFPVVFELDTLLSASKGNLLSQYVASTDNNGRASTTLTLGNKIGSYRVRAAATGLIGSPIEFLATATTGPAAKILRISGTDQTGKTSTALANPFVVKVVDAGGNAVTGVNVNFAFATVPPNALGHSLGIISDQTNNNGRATTVLTFGSQPGVYVVTASANGLAGSPITFSATADLVNNLKTLTLMSGDKQSAPINASLSDSLVVKVTDAANNPVAGIGVTFALAAFPNDALGQTLSKTFVLTGTNGRAVTSLRLGNKVGTYTVTASASGLLNSPIEFTATATTGAAANLAMFDGDQQAGTINTTLQKPLVVKATDVGGNPVAGASLNFEIFSFPNGATGHRLSSSQLTTDKDGQAATTFTLGDKLGNYLVTAKIGTLPASTVTFTARAEFTGRAEKILQTSGNNRDGHILTSLAEPFVVTVTDQAGNPVADYTVAFNIDTVPAEATRHSLSVSSARTDKDGRAATILTLGSKVGTYKVSAIAPKLSGSPVAFIAHATAGAVANMSANSADSQSGKIKKALANPFGVLVTDTEGNPVSGAEVTFTLKAPSGANGHVLNPTTAKTAESGAVTTALTLGDKTGKYIVEADLNGLVPVRFSAQATSEPPEIAAPSLPDVVTKAVPVTVRANIFDDIQVAEAKVFYRKGGETNFTEAPMSKNSGNNYQLEIPASAVTSRGVEFFVIAVDGDGNSVRHPLSGIISIPVTVETQSEQKSSTQPANSYRLISVPLNLADKTPRGVLKDDLGAYDRKKWRFFSLQADQSYTEFPNGTFESGKAFWLIVKESGRRLRIGPGISNSTAAPFVIPLHAGWNFIGNPFNFPAPAQTQLGNGTTFGLYSFDGTWSDPQSPELKELQPFEGYAVFTRTATTLSINPDRSGSSANRVRKEKVTPVWSIRIMAECGDALDRNNLAAVAAGAAREWDENDYPEPPVIGDYVSVYFPHQEWGAYAYNYCTDTRPEPRDGEIWKFAVRSNMHDKVQLTFAGVENVPPEYGVWLMDEVIGITQNLREQNQYAVVVASEQYPRQMKLLVGKANFAGEKLAAFKNLPATFELSQNFPNPFWSAATSRFAGNPATTIRYGLPQPARVTLKVFNALGEEVAILLNDAPQAAGYHAAIWNGRNHFGEAVASGLFFYRLQAGALVLTKKMVLVR